MGRYYLGLGQGVTVGQSLTSAQLDAWWKQDGGGSATGSVSTSLKPFVAVGATGNLYLTAWIVRVQRTAADLWQVTQVAPRTSVAAPTPTPLPPLSLTTAARQSPLPRNGEGVAWPTVPVTVRNYEEKEIAPQAVIREPQPGAELTGTITVRGFVNAWLTKAVLLLDGQPLAVPVSISQRATPIAAAVVGILPSPGFGMFSAQLDTLTIPDGAHTLGVELTVAPFIVKTIRGLGWYNRGLGEVVGWRKGAEKKIRVNIPVSKPTGTTTTPPPAVTPSPAPFEPAVPPVPMSWFEQESVIAGVKNWWLLAGAVGLYLLTQKGDSRA